MDKNIQLLLLLAFAATAGQASPIEHKWKKLSIVSRQEWGAKPPKETPDKMANPVPFVIIHHSYIPAACYSNQACIKAMQSMQTMHQVQNNWNDIGYSFGVGGDGRIYMGRGWTAVGAHAPTYNNQSIGICLIGDWRNQLPSDKMLHAVNNLISFGVHNGHIQSNYELYGHRQVRNGTECPGDALFNEISTWEHFKTTPPHVHYPTLVAPSAPIDEEPPKKESR